MGVITIQIAVNKIDRNKGQIEGLPKNPRFIRDEKFELLKKSIQENPEMLGLRELLVYPVGERYVVIGGNMRLEACKALGYNTVPCKVLDADTPVETLKAYTIKDNAGFGEWDWDMLANEWDSAQLTEWGVDVPEWETEEEPQQEAKEDDFDETKDEIQPIAQRGDIWQLGNHRLMCGDSTSAEDVARLMDGEKATLCITDPPYGVSIGDRNKVLNEHNGTHSIERNIENDTLSSGELHKLLTKAMVNCRENSEDFASYYVFSPQGGDLGMMMMMMMQDANLRTRHMLVWVKNAAVFSMGRLDYDYKHEPILYTWTKSHKFYGRGYNTSVFDDQLDVDKLKKDELLRLVKEMMSDKYPTTVIKENKPLKNDLHPTMKPIPLIGRLMNNSSQRGEIVIDLFGGSGSTLIAAEQLGRKARLMELDPHYCDVIIARWEKLTGQKATKL